MRNTDLSRQKHVSFSFKDTWVIGKQSFPFHPDRLEIKKTDYNKPNRHTVVAIINPISQMEKSRPRSSANSFLHFVIPVIFVTSLVSQVNGIRAFLEAVSRPQEMCGHSRGAGTKCSVRVQSKTLNSRYEVMTYRSRLQSL